MHLFDNTLEVVELYNDSNIQNQDINDFWIDDMHYVKKTSIKGFEYYEGITDMYFNSYVTILLSQKYMEDFANGIIFSFMDMM